MPEAAEKSMINLSTAVLFVFCYLIIFSILKAREIDTQSEAGNRNFITYGVSDKILVETDVKDARAAIDFWIDEFAEAVSLELKGQVYTEINSLYKDFKLGKLDWINVTLLDYLTVMKDIEAELGPVPLRGGKKTRNYLLIVRSDSQISHPKELAGKILAVAKNNEVGELYLNTLLLQNSMKESEYFFSEIIEKRTFSQAILAVFFKQADACIAADYSFHTLAELNPQILTTLKIIEKSQNHIRTITLYRKGLDDTIKKKLTDTMCSLDNTIEGKQVRLLFMIDGMVPSDETDIEPMRMLLDKYTSLKKE